MPHENFIKKTEQESPNFEALISILDPLSAHVKEGRKFLSLVNHIVDFGLMVKCTPERGHNALFFIPLQVFIML